MFFFVVKLSHSFTGDAMQNLMIGPISEAGQITKGVKRKFQEVSSFVRVSLKYISITTIKERNPQIYYVTNGDSPCQLLITVFCGDGSVMYSEAVPK